MKKSVLCLALGIPISYLAYVQQCNAQKNQRDGVIMHIVSSAFDNGQAIPEKYTCKGADISLPLSWQDAPKNTKSFALIIDDPDAPTTHPFVHWVVYNIDAQVKALPEGVSFKTGNLKAQEGLNDFKKIGYGGPCPPQGHGMHRYHIKLYALAIQLDLADGASKNDLMRAMQGHVLADAHLIGTFEIK